MKIVAENLQALVKRIPLSNQQKIDAANEFNNLIEHVEKLEATNSRVKIELIEALHTDGEHHKQWYLESVLKQICTEEEFTDFLNRQAWEDGIAP